MSIITIENRKSHRERKYKKMQELQKHVATQKQIQAMFIKCWIREEEMVENES